VAKAGADYNQQRGKGSFMYTVRVPHIQIGDYLAQIKAIRLANVQTFGSQCLASKQSSICATDRYMCAQIEKWSIFMCICISAQRNHNFIEQIRR
jgi:hypothetical protein